MCQTSAPVNMPLNTAGAGGPSFTGNPVNSPDDANGISTAVPGAPPNMFQGPNGGGDPLTNALEAEKAANPQTVSVNAPTKFGKLLGIALPILEGGVVGAAGGKGHPGGGFGAAQDFYNQRRAYNTQQTLLQHTLQNDQYKNALEAARTIHETNQPYFTRGGLTPATDDQGNDVMAARNPFNGTFEAQPGLAPPNKNTTPKTVETDRGLMSIGKDGTPTPVTLPGPSTPPGTAMVPVRPNDPNSPRVSTAVPGSQGPGTPLHAPGFSTPKPTKTTNRNAAGVETDSLTDENPNSPTYGKPVGGTVATRQPKPQKPSATDKRAELAGQVEEAAGYALDSANGDPDKATDLVNKSDMDPSKKAQVRQRIRERGKKSGKKSALDMLSQPSGAPQEQDDDENQ